MEQYHYTMNYDSNYIANYIFLTRLAMNYGRVEGLSHENMIGNDYKRIFEDFKGGMVGNLSDEAPVRKAWSEVLAAAGVADTEENRKLFIYGIAIHLVSDIFAHSAWARYDGGTTYKRIKHNQGADDSHTYSSRYAAVQLVLRNVLMKAYFGGEGSVKDFIISTSYFGTEASTRYCLGNFESYVKAVDLETYNNNKDFFQYVDLQSVANGKYTFD